MKHYLLVFNEDWEGEHNIPALDIFNEDEFNTWKNAKLTPYAFLGNGGDYFQKSFIGQEYIDKGIVKFIEVDDNFISIFNKMNLANLSLCDIFCIMK